MIKQEEVKNKELDKSQIKFQETNVQNTQKTVNIKDKKKIIKIYSISLLLFLISYILYALSLTGCMKTEYECLTEKRVKFFYKLGVATFFSSIFFSILIKFLIKHKKRIALVIYSFIFLIQVFSNGGEDMEHHGRLNMIGFFLFLFVSFIVIKIAEKFYTQIKKKKYKKIIIIL